jgi:hypothetical protein
VTVSLVNPAFETPTEAFRSNKGHKGHLYDLLCRYWMEAGRWLQQIAIEILSCRVFSLVKGVVSNSLQRVAKSLLPRSALK